MLQINNFRKFCFENARNELYKMKSLIYMPAILLLLCSIAPNILSAQLLGIAEYCGVPVYRSQNSQGATAEMTPYGERYIRVDPSIFYSHSISSRFAIAHECAHHMLDHVRIGGRKVTVFSGGTYAQELAADCQAGKILSALGYKSEIVASAESLARQGHIRLGQYPSGIERARKIYECASTNVAASAHSNLKRISRPESQRSFQDMMRDELEKTQYKDLIRLRDTWTIDKDMPLHAYQNEILLVVTKFYYALASADRQALNKSWILDSGKVAMRSDSKSWDGSEEIMEMHASIKPAKKGKVDWTLGDFNFISLNENRTIVEWRFAYRDIRKASDPYISSGWVSAILEKKVNGGWGIRYLHQSNHVHGK